MTIKDQPVDPALEQIGPESEELAEPIAGAVDSALEVLSPAASAALERAELQAASLGSTSICAVHVLLVLPDDPAGAAVKILAEAGFTSETLASAYRFITGGESGTASPDKPLPRSPRLDELLLRAEKDARKRGAPQIGTLHLLAALLASKQGLAYFILESAGRGIASLTAAVSTALAAGVTDGE